MSITITKRDGSVVEFDQGKISNAIFSCFKADPSWQEWYWAECRERSDQLSEQVITELIMGGFGDLTVDKVQDAVELVLQQNGYYDAAKRYILYRAERDKVRNEVPASVKLKFADSHRFFKTPLQEFQFYDKYSRYDYTLGRRETWVETVTRAVDYLHSLAGSSLDRYEYEEMYDAIVNMEVMPSMRLMAMAGPAATRNNIAIYNCAYLPVDSIDSFVEALLISMAGCGVGYSVESRYVEKLPNIAPVNLRAIMLHTIEDSAEGWGEALRFGLNCWFNGLDVHFDYSNVRPNGAVLKTKGGRASGPAPLKKLLDFARRKIQDRAHNYEKLTTLDAHDIMCMVGSAAVSGGVRRTAMLALFDDSDQSMRTCKDGDLSSNIQRWNSNNSAVWNNSLTDQVKFMEDFTQMLKSGRGEPGIFNREVAYLTKPDRRGRDFFGTNPCGEIFLRPYEFCNLSSAIAREWDDYESLSRKVRLAAKIGCIQSLATNFPGLRDKWKQNCIDERLIGVDITGQRDCFTLPTFFSQLKKDVVEEAVEVSKALNINMPAATTCVKPSGNTSQLVNCASGLHARWSPYYIRRVRLAKSSPLFDVLEEAGVPLSPENGQDAETAHTWVASFPVKSPEGSLTRADLSAIDQCEYWLSNKLNWTEHNPSVTITYDPDEVIELMAWVWKNRNRIGGMAFLPKSDAKYDQLPYEEIDEETYNKMVSEFPAIDFSRVYLYEHSDHSSASSLPACDAEKCEI